MRPLLIALFALSTACSSLSVTNGSALRMGEHWGTGYAKPLPPGHEEIEVVENIDNVSGRPVTIVDVRPLWAPQHQSTREIGFGLISRNENMLHTPELASFNTDPPVWASDSVKGAEPCVWADIRPVRGFLLPPTQGSDRGALLAIRVKLGGQGRYRLAGIEVTYEIDGVRYRQTASFEIQRDVRPGVPPRPVEPDERRCVEELGAKLLPRGA